MGAQQGLLGLVALGDILENPGQVDAAALAGDTPPGRPHPECGAVLLPRPGFADVRLAGHEYRKHFGAVALIVGFAEIKDTRRSPGQFLRPVAENFGQLAIAAQHRAVPREQDAHRRIVENQLLFVEGLPCPLLGLARRRDVLDQPDRLGLRTFRIKGAAADPMPHHLAVGTPECLFAAMPDAGRELGADLRVDPLEFLVAIEKSPCRLTRQRSRGQAEHFLKATVAARKDALAHHRYTQRGGIEDCRELAGTLRKRLQHRAVGRDVLDDPQRAVARMLGIDGLGRNAAPEQAAVAAFEPGFGPERFAA